MLLRFQWVTAPSTAITKACASLEKDGEGGGGGKDEVARYKWVLCLLLTRKSAVAHPSSPRVVSARGAAHPGYPSHLGRVRGVRLTAALGGGKSSGCELICSQLLSLMIFMCSISSMLACDKRMKYAPCQGCRFVNFACNNGLYTSKLK